MSNCGSCTKLRPIRKTTSSSCSKKKEKIDEVRIYCPQSVTEVVSETIETGCITGYISNIINPDPLCNSVPIVSVDVLNPDDLEETNDYAFDRAEDEGTDSYALTPLKLKIRDPEQQCTLDSWKGQDLGILYKITNREGDYQWRRLLMKLTGVTGGLLSGYEITFDTLNPKDTEKPLYVNFGSPELTENGIDALTDFDGTGGCAGLLYSRDFTTSGNRLEVTDYTLPLDSSKIMVFKEGLLMIENDPDGYQISGNGIDILDPNPNTLYQILVYA